MEAFYPIMQDLLKGDIATVFSSVNETAPFDAAELLLKKAPTRLWPDEKLPSLSCLYTLFKRFCDGDCFDLISPGPPSLFLCKGF